MTRSSEVVMRLNGCDATDGMFDLVFSRPQGQLLTLTFLLQYNLLLTCSSLQPICVHRRVSVRAGSGREPREGGQ